MAGLEHARSMLRIVNSEGWVAEVAPLLGRLRISGYYFSSVLRERVLLQYGSTCQRRMICAPMMRGGAEADGVGRDAKRA